MSGWMFALGFAAGSVWTFVMTRTSVRFSFKVPALNLRPQYAVLKVTDPGGRKIQCIKHIRAVTRLGLKEAKDASEGVPLTLTRLDADELAQLLHGEGATVLKTYVRRSS